MVEGCCKEAFRKYDPRGKGYVHKSKLSKLLQQLSVTPTASWPAWMFGRRICRQESLHTHLARFVALFVQLCVCCAQRSFLPLQLPLQAHQLTAQCLARVVRASEATVS